MTAATHAWATAANRKQIHKCLLKLDVMARDDPNRSAIICEVAALMGVPGNLSGGSMIERVHRGIDYLNRTTPRPSRIEVCHHEAGHAIVADALGIRVRQVSMRAVKNTGGSCLVLPANQQRGLTTPA